MTASSHTTNPKTAGAATIRDACAADATAIAELGSHVFTDTFAHSVQPHELQQFLEESYTTAAVAKDMEDPSRDIIVATSPDDEIIGFAYLTRGSSEPCIADVKNTVELQRIYGFEKIWLGVWEENHKAIRAYQKWGYEQVGDHDFAIGPVIQTDYIMLKDL
ncbi:acetyltransferase [Dactylonectria macrodidyma]|uniref:Acetyltransferase n=1 Tax=Dactylonectria macrodidyma TaxID=307937 RepID=A0A9P9D1W6_9HYPO|nr:acetyltransferase [Dactylonectria macrodidyma]